MQLPTVYLVGQRNFTANKLLRESLSAKDDQRFCGLPKDGVTLQVHGVQHFTQEWTSGCGGHSSWYVKRPLERQVTAVVGEVMYYLLRASVDLPVCAFARGNFSH